MTIPVLVTGDDFALPVNLTANEVAVNVAGATITAGIVGTDHAALHLQGIAQSSGATGANWGAGLVAVEFTAAQTAAIVATGAALIELQVASPAKATWFIPIQIVRGHVA